MSQTKGIHVPSGSVRVSGSGILGPIGIHCDTWKKEGVGVDFQASQCNTMGPNLPLTLLLGMGIA